MMQTLENRTQVRDALKGRRVRNVEFGSPYPDEVRSLALHLDDGSSVVIAATSYQTLEVEGS